MKQFITIEERNLVYRRAANKWGVNAQLVKAMEELGELTVELAKTHNGIRNMNLISDASKLIDELTDAQIMIEQVIYNFKFQEHVITQRAHKLSKLERLLDENDN